MYLGSDKIYYRSIQDMADLWQKVTSSSAGFQLSVIDEAVDQWQ